MKRIAHLSTGIVALITAAIARAFIGGSYDSGVAQGVGVLVAIPFNICAMILGLVGVIVALIGLFKPSGDGKRPVVSAVIGLLLSGFALYLGLDLFF